MAKATNSAEKISTQNEGEQELNEKDVDKQEDVRSEAEKAITKLDSTYTREIAAGQMMNLVGDDIKESSERIEELRQEIGVDNDSNEGGLEEKNADKLEALAEEQADLQEKMEGLEKLALDVPPDLDGTEQESDPFQAMQDMESFVDQAEDSLELDEVTKAELQKMREQAVEKFIEDSTKYVLDHLDSTLDECENKNNAVKIIELKTANTVRKAAQKFIKNGGKPDYGFEVSIKMVKHDTPEGEVKFVTGYTVDIKGQSAEDIGLDESEEGEKFVDEEDTEEELRREKEKGNEKEISG